MKAKIFYNGPKPRDLNRIIVSYLTCRFLENPARRWLNAKAADRSGPIVS